MKEIEKEVDIWDMFWFICQKWRVLVITGIIFMILFGAFGAYKNMNSGSEKQSFDKESAFEELPLVEQNRVQQYFLAENIYDEVLEQNEQDELLSLDYTNIYQVNMEYIIDGNDNSVVIAKSLEDNVDGMWGSSTDLNRFNESYLSYDSSATVYDGVGKEQPKAVILFMTVYGVDEEACQTSIKRIEEAMKEVEKELKSIFGQYHMKSIKGESCASSCEKLKNYVNDKKNFEYTKLNNKVTVSAALSEEAKNYVEQYKNAEMTDEAITDDSVVSENKEAKGIEALINIKYLLFGFVAGGMVAAAAYCVGYIINAKIKFEDDIEAEYGLNLLGRVSDEPCKTNRTKLDKWFFNIRRKNIHNFTYNESVEIIASEIKVKALKLGINKVYATGSAMGERQKGLVKDVAKALSGSNIELVNGRSILYYPEALEESSKLGNIVLFEKCNESKYMEIEQEMRKAEARGLEIIGIVLVE